MEGEAGLCAFSSRPAHPPGGFAPRSRPIRSAAPLVPLRPSRAAEAEYRGLATSLNDQDGPPRKSDGLVSIVIMHVLKVDSRRCRLFEKLWLPHGHLQPLQLPERAGPNRQIFVQGSRCPTRDRNNPCTIAAMSWLTAALCVEQAHPISGDRAHARPQSSKIQSNVDELLHPWMMIVKPRHTVDWTLLQV